MSKGHDKASVYSFPRDLHTQTPKEQLATLAREYLEAMRPYFDQMRELAEPSEDHTTEAAQGEAGEACLEELARGGQRERTYDAIADALSFDIPKSDRDFLFYELLRQSADPYEECWVLTERDDEISPPLPMALRHRIEQVSVRSPGIRYVVDRAHWLDRKY